MLDLRRIFGSNANVFKMKALSTSIRLGIGLIVHTVTKTNHINKEKLELQRLLCLFKLM